MKFLLIFVVVFVASSAQLQPQYKSRGFVAPTARGNLPSSRFSGGEGQPRNQASF
jgi:hypothetical protein